MVHGLLIRDCGTTPPADCSPPGSTCRTRPRGWARRRRRDHAAALRRPGLRSGPPRRRLPRAAYRRCCGISRKTTRLGRSPAWPVRPVLTERLLREALWALAAGQSHAILVLLPSACGTVTLGVGWIGSLVPVPGVGIAGVDAVHDLESMIGGNSGQPWARLDGGPSCFWGQGHQHQLWWIFGSIRAHRASLALFARSSVRRARNATRSAA
jgi:hypothetical protein